MADLEDALKRQDTALFDELFLADSYWRDLVAFTWDTRQFWGRDTVREELFAGAATMRPSNFRRQINRSLPRLLASPSPRVEIFFAFDTDVGTGSAFLVLRPDETAKW